VRYYKCVNCGYRGDFKFYRSRNVKCQKCEYDLLTEYEEDEYNEWMSKFGQYQEEPDGKSKGTTDK